MVKPEYKQTEIGIIPEEWEVVTIGDVASFQGGSQPPIQHFVFQEQEGYIRLVQIRDYKTDKYLTYIPISLAKRFCTKDDIMIGRYGPPIFQILRGIEGSYNVALIKATPKDVDKEFLFYILKAETLFEYIDLLSRRSSGQTGVDLDGLREYKIGLPPKSEQICIADALSNMDRLISVIEKQIAKKKGIKQGAMQELLTGKKRLPGFSGDWQKFILMKHSKIKARIGWQGLKKSEYLDSGYALLVTGTDFADGKVQWDSCHYVTRDRYDQDRNIQIQNNDILITKDGSLGKAALVRGLSKPATLNSGIFVIRPLQNAYDPVFVYHILSSFVFKDFLDKLSAGSTIIHLYQKDVGKFEFLLPPTIEEQKAIAEVLSEMDADIAALEEKLAKYRQVKQGMMQQLLTGKIRLV